jgi:hypothetical protein
MSSLPHLDVLSSYTLDQVLPTVIAVIVARDKIPAYAVFHLLVPMLADRLRVSLFFPLRLQVSGLELCHG